MSPADPRTYRAYTESNTYRVPVYLFGRFYTYTHHPTPTLPLTSKWLVYF